MTAKEDGDGGERGGQEKGQSREGDVGGAHEIGVKGIEEENGFQMGLDRT